MKAARRRKGRLHILKKILGGNRAVLIAASGVLPAAIYGAAVSGMSDHELLQLRRISASAMTPAAKGRSLSALMLLRGDPTWTAAVAPLQQWVRAGWNAAQDKDLVGRGIDLEFMMEAWDRDAPKRLTRLVNSSGKRAWGKVKGPIDALELSLHRLGWHT